MLCSAVEQAGLFLSVCLLSFLRALSLSLTVGFGLLCLPERYWQRGNLCAAKQASALATVKEHTMLLESNCRINGKKLLLRTLHEIELFLKMNFFGFLKYFTFNVI